MFGLIGCVNSVVVICFFYACGLLVAFVGWGVAWLLWFLLLRGLLVLLG